MQTNRLIAAVRAIIRAEFPNYTYNGIYEYAIQSVSGNLVAADPTDTTLGLTHIGGIELRPSLLGETVTPVPGDLILVGFINGIPTRPFAISLVGTNTKASFDAVQIEVGRPALLPAARVTDPVLVAGWMAGNIVQGSTKVKVA